jgi:hypothetical protein
MTHKIYAINETSNNLKGNIQQLKKTKMGIFNITYNNL